MIMDNNQDVYIVSIDSRAHSTSDLECYKEQTCSDAVFSDHLRDNPKNICVKSQVAALCGLDLKFYFHDLPAGSHLRQQDELIGLLPMGRINGAATLLTFNPDTGYYNYIVRSKAYVVLNNGKKPLSKRQVWGIIEFIREAKETYHRNGGHFSLEAKQELLASACEYHQGTWAPHSIYELRHVRHHYFPKRMDSGMSDQATCHHGHTHIHHDGHHECCHGNAWADDKANPIKNHHVVSYSKDDEDEVVVEEREHSVAQHNRGIATYEFYNSLCHS